MSVIDLMQLSPLFFLGSTLVFGLLVGSFLNVVIYRLPIMLEREWRAQCTELFGNGADENVPTEPFNLIRPGSACPQCRTPIRAWQNIPLLGWLLLRGRCANCRASIPARYPAIELLTGICFLLVAWRFGVTWETAAALLLTAFLIGLSFIDIDHQILPDNMTLPLLWVGLALTLWHGAITGQTLFIAPKEAIVGALAGYLSLWSVYWLFKLITGKEGMGHGDFKLLAALGAWLGWKLLPLIIILSALVGAVIGIAMIAIAGRDRQVPIPFGPYLAAAGWIALLWGDALVSTYLRTAGM